MNWLKHYIWFLKESKSFLDCSYFKIIKQGGLYKGIKHANAMVKWDKMTPQQKEQWYLYGEDRTIDFDLD